MRILESGRKRLLASAVVMLVLLAAGVSFYLYRTAQTAKVIAALRPAGIAALEAGEHRIALDKLGTYLQRHPDDMPTLYLYSKARLQSIETNGSHLAQGINVLKRIVQSQPNHIDARRDLLKLYQQVNYLTETIDLADDILALKAADEQLKADALFAKAVALTQLRRYEEAERVLALAQPQLRHHLLSLQLLRDSGKPADSVLAYAAKLGDPASAAGAPADTQLLLIHAIARRIINEPQEAVRLLTLAASNPAGSDEVILELVRQLDSVGEFKTATAALAVAAAPEDRLVLRRNLAARLWQAGSMDELAALLAPVAAAPAEADSQLLVYHVLLSQNRGAAPQIEAGAAALAARNDDVAAAWSPLIKQLTSPSANTPAAEALKLYNQSLELLPADPLIRLMRGRAHAAANRVDPAVSDWVTTTRIAPSWYLPYVHLSQMYLRTGRIEEAYAHGQQAVRLGGNRPDAAIAFTLAAAAVGEPRVTELQVLHATEQIQKAMPNEPQTLPLYANLLAKTGRLTDAAAILAGAATNDAALSEDVLLRLAAVSYDQKLDAAQALLQRSAEQHGVSPKWAGFQAALKLMANDVPGALAAFEQARAEAKMSGEPREWQLSWAGLLDRVGDKRANDAWVALAADYPNDADVLRAVLAARSVQADRDLQARCIAQLRKISEEGADWRFAQARWLLGRDKELKPETAAEAAVLLHDVLRQNTRHVEAHRLLAFCLQRTGNTRGALDQLHEAVRLRPDRPDLTLDLASALYASGDFAGSLQVLDRAIDGLTLSDQQRQQAAMILGEQNQIDLAVTALEPAAQAEQRDLLLARLYAAQGENAKARQLFEQVLAGPHGAKELPLLLSADFFASQSDRQRADELLGRLAALPDLKPGVADLMHADHYARFNVPEKAAERFAAATMAASSNPLIWRARIRFLLATGKISEAVSVISAAAGAAADPILTRLSRETSWIVRTDKTPIVWTLLATAAVQDEHADAALANAKLILDAAESGKQPAQWMPLLRRAAALHPDVLSLQNVTATLLIADGKHEDAATLASRAMARYPKAPEPAAIATDAYARANSWNAMLDAARQWHARSGQSIASHLAVAGALMMLQQPVQAIAELEPRVQWAVAHAADREAFKLIDLYARALIAAKRVDDAGALLEPLLTSPSARVLWWQLAVSQRDPKVAELWMQKLTSATAPDALNEHLRIAQGWRVLAGAGGAKNPEYETRWRTAVLELTQHPDATAAIHFERGSLAEIDNDLPVAEAHYRRSLELNADAALSKNNLAMVIIRRRGGADEALRLANEAAEAFPGAGAVQDTLAHAHVYAGQPQRALEIITPVVDQMKSNSGVRPEQLAEFELSRAWILAESGDIPAARALYAQLQPSFAKLTAGNPSAQERLARLQELLNRVSRTSSAADAAK